jgi:ABC-type nitrate/sulfonate/bicarbonate transport system substrate-binding protein
VATHRVGVVVAVAATALVTACSSSSSSSPPSTAAVGQVTADGIPADRCAANRAAGTITYLSGFDFAATASVVEVVVAKEKGYFDKMCLDVQLKPSFSTANYPLVAAGRAQFGSAGSYTEVLQQSKGGAHFVVVANDGKQPIDTLIVKADAGVRTVADLRGKTIGVLGAMPPSITAMLAKNGLQPGSGYKTVLLNGFDPVAQFRQAIVGRPGYKSNEPGILRRAGVPFITFDPESRGIPGSFGVIYTSAKFHQDHPTAVQDFVRAAMKGLADAIADPPAAVATCVKLIDVAGNQNHLTSEGESFRWSIESKLVVASTPAGEAIGLVDPARLQAEVDAYAAAGALTPAPSTAGTYDADLVRAVYAPDRSVIWPR